MVRIDDQHSNLPRRVDFRDGVVAFRSVSSRRIPVIDLYHRLMKARWRWVLAWIALSYVVSNVLFAMLYLMGGDCISGAEPGSFVDAFQFSVHTLSTIGFGNMVADTTYAKALVSIESFVGLVAVALGTGLIFSKFTRPLSRVEFSQCMVIHTRNGVPCLLFRMSNRRGNQVVEAKLTVNVLADEVTEEGHRMRRFYELALERARTPMFSLSWTAIHPITPESPLYGLDAETIHQHIVGIVAIFTGLDETYAQGVHARYFYNTDQIFYDMRFKDMLFRDAHYNLLVNFDNIHEIVSVDTPVGADKP